LAKIDIGCGNTINASKRGGYQNGHSNQSFDVNYFFDPSEHDIILIKNRNAPKTRRHVSYIICILKINSKKHTKKDFLVYQNKVASRSRDIVKKGEIKINSAFQVGIL